MTWEVPDPRTFDSLLDLLDDASRRWAGRRQLALRTDEGLTLPWTAADLRHHSKLVAWRLRALGLNEGDRLEFEIEVDRRGKFAAVNLQPISE